MTTVLITRNQIIEAIRKEPVTTLAGGSWVWAPGGNSQVSNKNCTVCAVGAVMRHALLSPRQPALSISAAAEAAMEGGYASSCFPEEGLETGHYMAALSSFFEDAYDTAMSALQEEADELDLTTKQYKEKHAKAVERVRRATTAFVRKNFPKTLTVDIDGAKPAKDVIIVNGQKSEARA